MQLAAEHSVRTNKGKYKRQSNNTYLLVLSGNDRDMKCSVGFFVITFFAFVLASQSNPCEDSLFLVLKGKPVSEMNPGEASYFASFKSQCNDFIERKTAEARTKTLDSLISIEQDIKDRQHGQVLKHRIIRAVLTPFFCIAIAVTAVFFIVMVSSHK